MKRCFRHLRVRVGVSHQNGARQHRFTEQSATSTGHGWGAPTPVMGGGKGVGSTPSVPSRVDTIYDLPSLHYPWYVPQLMLQRQDLQRSGPRIGLVEDGEGWTQPAEDAAFMKGGSRVRINQTRVQLGVETASRDI